MLRNGRVFTVAAAIFALAQTAVMWGCSGIAATHTPVSNRQAKYVFLFIGDGMGRPQREAAEIYARGMRQENGRPDTGRLTMNAFPVHGVVTTNSADAPVTDSAAAGTALACGVKTNNGALGLDPEGRAVPSLAEIAVARGMRVGIISNVALNHATPAAFYAHQSSRGSYYDIGLELVRSPVHYFGGGGLLQNRGADGTQLPLLTLAAERGFLIVNDRRRFERLCPSRKRVLAISDRLDEAHEAMPYALDRSPDDLTLADHVRKAIRCLDNPRGFFLMVEGGRIDWACHANDAATAIHEVLDLDEAVREAVRFAARHAGETLIVVTADHETGGMALDYEKCTPAMTFEALSGQGASQDRIRETLLDALQRDDHFDADGAMRFLRERLGAAWLDPSAPQCPDDKDFAAMWEVCERLIASRGQPRPDLAAANCVRVAIGILDARAGITWTCTSHTAAPVPLSAFGTGQELFTGEYDNTEVPAKILAAMGQPAPTRVPRTSAAPPRSNLLLQRTHAIR